MGHRLRWVLATGALSICGTWGLGACSSTVTGTAEIRGAIDAATFSSEVRAIEVRDEAGAVMRPTVEAGGAFRFHAVEGHTYSMHVVTASGLVPVLFPRGSGLDGQFQVVGGGATANLGKVKHYDAVPAEGFVVRSAVTQQCEDEDDEDDEDGDWGGDGECENGVDATTGLACADGDDHQDGADEPDGDDGDGQHGDAHDFAAPDNSLPSAIGCEGEHEDGDDEDDDDDEEEDDD